MTNSLLLEYQGAPEAPTQPIDADALAVDLALDDPAAFATLYRRYAVDVFRYCARRTDDREAAEDLTSQIFMRALSTLPTLRNRPFRAWLFAIAHNLVIDDWRKRKSTVSIDHLSDLVGDDASPEQIALQHERSSEIHALLQHLPERERQIVELRLAGLSGQEIALVMGSNPAAVRMTHHRAVEHLRNALQDPARAEWSMK